MALARNQDRYGSADAAVAAGDERDLAGQPLGSRIAGHAVGLGAHIAFAARLMSLLLGRRIGVSRVHRAVSSCRVKSREKETVGAAG